jgi:hypothetical protein
MNEEVTLNTVEKLIQRHNQDKQQREILKEKEGEYRKALNAIAASDNGVFVFSCLVSAMGIFKPSDEANPAKVVQENAARNVYLRLIRPYLTSEVLDLIERNK